MSVNKNGISGTNGYHNGGARWSVPEPGEEVVISGVAGRFPDSDNMAHLRDNLMNKVDLVSSDTRRWQLDHPEIPKRIGKINDVEKFDSLFFGVHFKQAHTMDPICRMLLEHAYEAIIDAGFNPRQFRGSNTGVFIGTSFSESEKKWYYEKVQLQDEFKSCDTWEQRLSAFVNKLPEEMNLNFKVEDQRAICTSIYCRMKALQCYDPSTLLPLRTPITLLRPKVQAVRLMSADYGLGTLTREKVDVYYVDGNHVTMLDEDICAAVINGDPLENAKLS